MDMFLFGHCHEFAIALNSIFGYRLGLIKGKTYDKNGEERNHLFHAFGVDQLDQGFDIRGIYNYTEALNEYKTRIHPKNQMIPFDVELLILDKEDFIKEVSKFGLSSSFIDQGIKEIKLNPLLYYKQEKIKKDNIFIIETNEKYKINEDFFYNLKHDEKWDEQITSLIRGVDFIPFKVISFRFKHSGFFIGLGLLDYDLEINDLVYSVENKIKDISDEESLKNLQKFYLEEIPLFIKGNL